MHAIPIYYKCVSLNSTSTNYYSGEKNDGPFSYYLEFPIFGFSIRHHGINFVHRRGKAP